MCASRLGISNVRGKEDERCLVFLSFDSGGSVGCVRHGRKCYRAEDVLNERAQGAISDA